MESKAEKYSSEMAEILEEVVIKLAKQLETKIGKYSDEDVVTISKCVIKANQTSDLDFVAILSFLDPLKSPYIILRVRFDWKEVIDDDDFIIVGLEEETINCRPLDDFLNSGLLKDDTLSKLKNICLEQFYINIKKSEDVIYLFEDIKKKNDFHHREYRIIGHEKFKIDFYHLIKIEELTFKQSQLFMNKTTLWRPHKETTYSSDSDQAQLHDKSKSLDNEQVIPADAKSEDLYKSSFFTIGEVDYHKSYQKDNGFSFILIDTVTKPSQKSDPKDETIAAEPQQTAPMQMKKQSTPDATEETAEGNHHSHTAPPSGPIDRPDQPHDLKTAAGVSVKNQLDNITCAQDQKSTAESEDESKVEVLFSRKSETGS